MANILDYLAVPTVTKKKKFYIIKTKKTFFFVTKALGIRPRQALSLIFGSILIKILKHLQVANTLAYSAYPVVTKEKIYNIDQRVS
jgi:hypothetical protein